MASVPTFSSTLAEADGWWLSFSCPACRQAKLWPCRMLARDLSPSRTLEDIVPRLLCQRCRVRPDRVELVDNPQWEAPGYAGGGRAQHVLLLGPATAPHARVAVMPKSPSQRTGS